MVSSKWSFKLPDPRTEIIEQGSEELRAIVVAFAEEANDASWVNDEVLSNTVSLLSLLLENTLAHSCLLLVVFL
jgi:hypothetical protein